MNNFVAKFGSKKSKNKNFQTIVETSSGNLVYLVRGKENNQDVWHYVFVDKNKLPLFLNDIKNDVIDIAKYGDILYSGWGTEPPESTVNNINEKYL